MAFRIVTDRFSFRYPGRQENSLSNISLNIPPKSCCAILGPTSAGKTTFLHALAGSLGSHYPHGSAFGAMTLGDATYTPLPAQILFPSVSFLLHDPHVQMSGLCETVSEELHFSLSNAGLPLYLRAEHFDWVCNHLSLYPLLERNPATLSGGELQRVALATVLIVRPQVLLLDEPATSLDIPSQHNLARVMRAISSEATILFTDTSIDLAFLAADYFGVLHKGSLLFFGDRATFLHELERFADILPCQDWITISRLIITHRNSRNGKRFASLLK